MGKFFKSPEEIAAQRQVWHVMTGPVGFFMGPICFHAGSMMAALKYISAHTPKAGYEFKIATWLVAEEV